jgi:hypothetical protein
VLANLKSDSDYDAKKLKPKMCVNLGNQIGDQTPSPVIDSNQVAPKRPKEGRRCLTFRSLLKELAYLLVKDVLELRRRLINYAIETHSRVLDVRSPSKACGIAEDEVQFLVDGLWMYFPHGIIFQTPPEDSEIEVANYKPFEKPVFRISKKLQPIPVVYTRGSGKAITYCGWLTTIIDAKIQPWRRRTQEDFMFMRTGLTACQFRNKCRALEKKNAAITDEC